MVVYQTYFFRCHNCGVEARFIRLDFSAAFDRDNHAAMLHKLSLLYVGGSLLTFIKYFVMDRMPRVVADGGLDSYSNLIFGVPHGSVLGPLLFFIYISDLQSFLENLLIGYADDASLFSKIPVSSVVLRLLPALCVIDLKLMLVVRARTLT